MIAPFWFRTRACLFWVQSNCIRCFSITTSNEPAANIRQCDISLLYCIKCKHYLTCVLAWWLLSIWISRVFFTMLQLYRKGPSTSDSMNYLFRINYFWHKRHQWRVSLHKKEFATKTPVTKLMNTSLDLTVIEMTQIE